MKFFIDTANIDEIKEACSMGMVDGVTTNPSLIAKEGGDFEEIIKEILNLGSKVLLVNREKISILDSKDINYVLSDSNFKFDIIKSFINIPVFQILAYIKTIRESLDPDRPKSLDYTVII